MKCELDCIMPRKKTDENYAWPVSKPETEDIFANCLSLCTEKRAKCVDTEEVTQCSSCVEDCATSFDGSMLACVQGQNSKSKLTFGQDLDSCMIAASSIMDSCRSSCDTSGLDEFLGWTPETEAGIGEAGRTTSLRALRQKYQKMKNEGLRAIDEIDGNTYAESGLRDRTANHEDMKFLTKSLFGEPQRPETASVEEIALKVAMPLAGNLKSH